MSDLVIKVELGEGCDACPFEHGRRCFALESLRDRLTRCPEEGVHEDCPLQDGQTVDVVGAP